MITVAIFGAAGRVDRQALGRLVFDDREALESLNSLTHPALCARIRGEIKDALRREVPAIILDAPLLLENKLDTLCDFVVYIEVSDEVRLARALESRGWRPAEVARREHVQIPLKDKRQRADYTIDGNTSPTSVLEQVRRILSRVGNV